MHPASVNRSFPCSLAHIDELLAMIFSYLDDRALARAACVCKHWSEIALDCLWFEVNDLKRVLSVLAPFTLKPERVSTSTGRLPGAYAFKRSLSPADWARFQRYAQRVRRLRHDHRHLRSAMDRAKRPALIHSRVFDELSATCPTPDIFPNLQSLVWYPCAPERQRLCLAFMHRRVKHLGLHLYRSETPSLADFISQVCVRCPSLTNLDICLEEHMANFEDYVAVLLRGLPHLQRVSVPTYGLTPRLLTELSRLKHVATINLIHPARAELGNRTDVAQFFPVLAHDAFPALRSLSFSAQVEHATQLLRSSLFPAQLTELHFKAIVIGTPDALQDLFSVIRDRCTSLVQLSVDYIIAPDSPLTSPPPPLHDRPSIGTFRPLFSTRCVRTFEMRWDYALAISDDDMEEFARSWPSLESLQFNPEPVPEPDVPGLNLRVLLPFARYCPNLRHLGLHVDARTIPNLAPTPRSQSIPHFRRLEALAIGLSAIAKSEPVTLFLSQILPLGCSIVFGLRWPDAYDIALEHALVPVPLRAEMSNNHVRWNDVSRMLPIATKARMEEKARVEALERQMMELELLRSEDKQKLSWLEQEVQDLRGRTGRTP